MAVSARFCGFCGSELANGMQVCPNCGAEQPELPSESSSSPALASPAASKPERFCGFCGATIHATAIHCPECGQRQPELPLQAVEAPGRMEAPREIKLEAPRPGAKKIQTPPPVTGSPGPRRQAVPAPPITRGRPSAGARPVVQPRIPPATDQMVVVRNLSVTRGKKTLVQGIDFVVERGEIVGILGPSGAGKTTIIKVLTTEYPCPPSQVIIGGHDLATDARSAKQIFGYVPQDTQLYEDLTFLQNVLYFGGQYGMDQAYLLEKARRLATVVELGEKLNDKVARLSGGQKKRVSVATALAHDPEFVILDEPTSGLDPATRRGLWKFLKSMNQSYNVTMIVTTHYLDEAEYCDKLLIINKGHMVAYDSPRRLKGRLPGEGKAIELEMFTLDDYVSAKLSQFESKAKSERVAEMVDRSGYRVKVFCKDIPKATSEIPHLLAEVGLGFKSMNVVDSSLEDAFIYLTGEHFREED